MIKYMVLGLLLLGRISLGQTLLDSLPAPPAIAQVRELANPNHQVPGVLVPDKTLLLPLRPRAGRAATPASRLPKKINSPSSLVTPALLVGYGFLTLGNPEYLESNEAVQKEITWHYAGFRTRLDNYTRYVPLAAVYGLNLAGIKGQHDLVNLTMIFALSGFINNTITHHLKAITKETRPDFPSLDAFPSGHTSTAFANAEIMHQEYKHLSAWYGVSGYSFAVTTGTLRLLNNRHWLSDVVAGAGIGILSTRLAYVIYPWLQEKIYPGHSAHNKMAIAPLYQQGSYGISLGWQVAAKHPPKIVKLHQKPFKKSCR
jgi:membrane-associated phospholipid phosphatase